MQVRERSVSVSNTTSFSLGDGFENKDNSNLGQTSDDPWQDNPSDSDTVSVSPAKDKASDSSSNWVIEPEEFLLGADQSKSLSPAISIQSLGSPVPSQYSSCPNMLSTSSCDHQPNVDRRYLSPEDHLESSAKPVSKSLSDLTDEPVPHGQVLSELLTWVPPANGTPLASVRSDALVTEGSGTSKRRASFSSALLTPEMPRSFRSRSNSSVS